MPQVSDFAVEAITLPDNLTGTLVQIKYLSIDPFLRLRIKGNHQSGSIQKGEIMSGPGIVELLEDSAQHKKGTLLMGLIPWQEKARIDTTALKPIPSIDQPSLALGVLGMPGFTAWVGVNKLLTTKHLTEKDVVVVSAASGVVGSMVGHFIQSMTNAKVIGIAGSEEKCNWVTGTLGWDGCINYKTTDLGMALKQQAQQGISIYFDNVGGSVLNAVMENLAVGAQVLLCGLAQQYNISKPIALHNIGALIGSRASIKGMIIYDHVMHYPEFYQAVLPEYHAGKIKYKETKLKGISSAIDAMITQFKGENFGKLIIEVG